MPDTRHPRDRAGEAREALSQSAREAMAQTQDTGRRALEAGAESTRRTAQTDAESARRAVDAGAHTTHRALETGAQSVQRLTDTGTDILRHTAEAARTLTQQMSALTAFNTPEAEDAVRRASAAWQAVNQTGSVVAQMAQDTLATWATYGTRVTERRLDTLQRLTTVRSPAAALDLQAEHLRAEIELFVDHASRSAERTTDLFRQAGDQAKQVFEHAETAGRPAGRRGGDGV